MCRSFSGRPKSELIPSYCTVPTSLASDRTPLPFVANTRTFTVVVAGMPAVTGSIVTEPLVPLARAL